MLCITAFCISRAACISAVASIDTTFWNESIWSIFLGSFDNLWQLVMFDVTDSNRTKAILRPVCIHFEYSQTFLMSFVRICPDWLIDRSRWSQHYREVNVWHCRRYDINPFAAKVRRFDVIMYWLYRLSWWKG